MAEPLTPYNVFIVFSITTFIVLKFYLHTELYLLPITLLLISYEIITVVISCSKRNKYPTVNTTILKLIADLQLQKDNVNFIFGFTLNLILFSSLLPLLKNLFTIYVWFKDQTVLSKHFYFTCEVVLSILVLFQIPFRVFLIPSGASYQVSVFFYLFPFLYLYIRIWFSTLVFASDTRHWLFSHLLL